MDDGRRLFQVKSERMYCFSVCRICSTIESVPEEYTRGLCRHCERNLHKDKFPSTKRTYEIKAIRPLNVIKRFNVKPHVSSLQIT